MGIHLRLSGDDWGIIFTWDSFQPSTPAPPNANPAVWILIRVVV